MHLKRYIFCNSGSWNTQNLVQEMQDGSKKNQSSYLTLYTKILRFSRIVRREVWGLLVHAKGHREDELTTAWNNQDQRKERANICIKNWLGSSKACSTCPPACISHINLHGQGINGTLLLFHWQVSWRFAIISWLAKHPLHAIALRLSLCFSSSHPTPKSPFWWDFPLFFLRMLCQCHPYTVYFFQQTISFFLKVLYTSLFLS